jgi:GT2 family glycosyltransferase
MIDLSICIVNYNAKELLLECLESIYRQTGQLEIEIILADNGSSDGSVSAVREQFPKIKIIENDENLGFVKPTNQGMRASCGKYILLLNNDTVILDNALTKMVSFMESHPDVGVCGPKAVDGDGVMQTRCRRGFPTPWATLTYLTGLARLFPRSPLWSRYLMSYFDEDEIHETDAVSGSCLMIRRETMKQVGYLDEDYFAYGEDLDYCARVQKAGWKIYYYPQAHIIHYGGQGGSRVQPYRTIYHFHRSMMLFYSKHIAPESFFGVNWVVKFAIAAKFLWSVAINLLRDFPMWLGVSN